MKQIITLFRAGTAVQLGAFTLLMLSCASVRAQWQEIKPSGDKNTAPYVQFENDAGEKEKSPWKKPGSASFFIEKYQYDTATKTETFTINASNDDHRRVEVRGVQYSSGTYRFQGEVQIRDNTTDQVHVAQLFHAVLIDYQASEGGKLVYQVAKNGKKVSGVNGDGDVIAKGMKGKWVKLNMIHNGSNNTMEISVWIDGKAQNGGNPYKFKTYDSQSKDTEGFYFKYGAYTNPGQKQVVYWRNTQFWKKI
jgi:hypothetical protein